MKFIKTKIPEVIIVEPDIYGDERGYFCETFRQDFFEQEIGYKVNFCQDNESKSSYGVLRGLHYQMPPFTQSKLVRIIEGRVLDIAVDMRKGSPTFGESVSVELSFDNKKQLYIPRGFAHGFIVLSKEAKFAYKTDNYYAPQYERGVKFNDPILNINWKLADEEILLSDKDRKQPILENAELFEYGVNLYSKNVLVIGSEGQLGSEFKALSKIYSHYNLIFVDKEQLDISNFYALTTFFENNHIDTIINCAAYTIVDKAEDEENKADLINRESVKYLVKISKEKHIKFIHISTDFVFDGEKSSPYIESDQTNPIGVYGETKLAGEKEVLSADIDAVIIRTSWLYSLYGNNFVKTIQKLAKDKDELKIIFDQVGTPTYANDLARTILDILPKLNNKTTEIYHYSNEGAASWYDFAKAIAEFSNIECKILPIETNEYPTRAKRPKYSVLNKSNIKEAFSIEIPYWRDSLKICIKKLEKS